MQSLRTVTRLAAVALVLASSGALAATPPGQPRSGPGGADNPGAEIVKRAVGQASNATYVFHAAGAPSAPRPVVVLLHAWGAINPSVYGGWIDHLARRGYLVMFPAFQVVGKSRPGEATARARELVGDALKALATDMEAKPDLARLAYLGHSAGAGIAVNLAAEAGQNGLPEPRLVFLMMPGGIASDAASRGIPLDDLSRIGANVGIVAMVGDREFQASERVSRRIFRDASSVSQTRKLFVRLGSDDHGFPALSATLASAASPMEAYSADGIKLPPDPPRDPKGPRIVQPRWAPDMVLSGEQTVLVMQLGRNTTDTLDYLGSWKAFDQAAEMSFAGGEVSTLRTDAAFLDMGRWSDGWPVRRMAAEMPKIVDAAASPKVAPAPMKMPATRQVRQRRRI